MATTTQRPRKLDEPIRIRALVASLQNRGLLELATATALEHFATIDEVCGRCREARIVRARHAVWARLQADCGFSGAGIARLWGCDHTSVRTARLKREAADCAPVTGGGCGLDSGCERLRVNRWHKDYAPQRLRMRLCEVHDKERREKLGGDGRRA